MKLAFLSDPQFLATVATSLVGYVWTRAAARVDSFFKELRDLREEIGKLKKENLASWREIDKLRATARGLTDLAKRNDLR